MLVNIPEKQINESRRLAKVLASEVVPVKDIRNFFSEFNQRIDELVEPGKPKTRNRLRAARKEKYKLKIAS